MLANFSGVEFEKAILKFRKRKRKLLSCVHVLDKTRNLRHFHVVVVCSKGKEISCGFANLNLLLFHRSLLSPLLKLPNNLILGNLNGALIFSEFLAIKMYNVNNSIRLQKGRLKGSFSLGTAAFQGK